MSDTSDKTIRTWARVLRPLAWWGLLVLVLYGIRLHQRLMAGTYLSFRVTVEGKPNPYAGERVQLDGQDYSSHELVSLGKHRLTVTNPKTESFATNLFVWYGAHDLGEISLQRSKGVLQIKCDPAAARLSIQGPEFSTLLTNATDFSETVPTDTYRVNASYTHWEGQEDVMVTANSTATRDINPHMGALDLSCNKSGASFALLRNVNENAIQSGPLPVLVTELPAGDYRLNTFYHGHEKTEPVIVSFGITNPIESEFAFGTAFLDTSPSGAAVSDSEGHYWGQTPLTLSELQPGSWTFQLKLPRYEPVTTTMEIGANETQSFQTNLISFGYSEAMRSVHGYMNAGDYNWASSALGDALLAKPDDPDALALQREATGLGMIQHAKRLGQQGDYIGGGKELTMVLQSLPDNAEARQMLADFKQHEPEQIERRRVERLERPKKAFDSIMSKMSDAALFESYVLKTGKSAEETRAAIEAELKSVPPYFQIVRSDMVSGIFKTEATQDFPGGTRRCVIVGGQSKDDETQIYFKVIESRKVGFMNQPIPALLGAEPPLYTVIDPGQAQSDDKLRNQIAEGVATVTARIQSAIGQTPTYQPTPPQ